MRDSLTFGVFWREERGASAVEFAMVLPILIMLLLGIIQYGSLFLLQTEMTGAARDTARRIAVGEFVTDEAAEEFALAQLAGWWAPMTATVTLPTPLEHDIGVIIRTPMAEAAMLNIIGFGMTGELKAEVHMVSE